MADPISIGTLAVIGMGSAGAGAGVKAFGDILTGRSQAAAYNYQAGIADMNAKIARQDANYAIATGEVDAQQAGLKTAARVGAIRAGFAAGNLNLTSGSPNQVVTSQLAIGQQAEGITRANAAKRAYGFDVAAVQDDTQGVLDRMGATSAKVAGGVNAASSILGGVGQVATMGIQSRMAGIGTGSSVYTG